MTALITYGSNVAASTVSTADKLSSTTGGTETTNNTTAPNDAGNNEWIEVLSQGGTAAANASIPAPTGKGWLFDVTTLEGQMIAAGNWSDIFNISISGGAGLITLVTSTVRFYRRSSGGIYTSIGSITVSGISVTGSKQQVSSGNVSLSSAAFSTGDKLYIDRWLQSGTSSDIWSGDTVAIYVSNSGTAGVANDAQTTTPGYSSSSTHHIVCDGYGGCFS